MTSLTKRSQEEKKGGKKRAERSGRRVKGPKKGEPNPGPTCWDMRQQISSTAKGGAKKPEKTHKTEPRNVVKEG